MVINRFCDILIRALNLVKSACATNMSKHLERHHQNIIPTSVIDAEYGVQKYEQPVVTNGYQQEQWNPYSQTMEPPKVITSFDPYQHAPHSSHDAGPPIPWNPDRRGAKRNRRTKHPVWELFRRTADGNAQCQLCHVVVRSPCSSNFMGHLNRHHSEHYQNIYNRWLEGRVDIPILTS
uniref:BED-type domain-containing protein n=1 Tax=Heterorhabditis bacteriophora TaxID=37862 RepID=A0A1I7XIT8_HETBA